MHHQPIVHVLDDDAAVRDSLKVLLEASGFQTRLYERPSQFLDALPINTPGCLILDLRLGDGDGLELQELLSRTPLTLPTIVVTGYASVRSAVQAMRGGALDFLEKPFDEGLLVSRVREAVALDCEARELQARKEAVLSRLGALTRREREVMDLVVAGRANKQVAAELGISMKTVEAHRAHVMTKMQADSLAELVRMVTTTKPSIGSAGHHNHV